MGWPKALTKLVEQALAGSVSQMISLSGGDINEAYRVELVDGRRAFLKYNQRAPAEMFAAEARGLAFLRAAGGELVIPDTYAHGRDFLLLQLLEQSSRGQAVQLGVGLATLHRSNPGTFGMVAVGSEQDNFIGTLPQKNAASEDWPTFYREQRLEPQLLMQGVRRAYDAAQRAVFERLLNRLDQLLGPAEPPARLHGDLWGGNWMATSQGPAVFDPAVYGGHREVDLAMMRLFGGFDARTFASYEECYPLAPGADERLPLYQLYPLLVHTNLFGGSYAAAAYRIARDFA